MRLYFFLLTIFLAFSGCSTRNLSGTRKQRKVYTHETRAFINSIRKTQFPSDTILLVDRPNMKEVENCLNLLFQDSSLFTPTEQELIRIQIGNPALKKWNADLVDHADFISRDTLNAIFKDGNRSWTYFHKRYGSSFHSFSAPIFLRNNTLCLFYSDYACGGLCGAGHTILYKKEEESWIVFKSFCYWIS